MKAGQVVKIWTHCLMCPKTGEQLGIDKSKFVLYMLLEESEHWEWWECLNLETMRVRTMEEYILEEGL